MAGDTSNASPKPETAPRRKFAVEPVETSARSSKQEREKKEKEKEKDKEQTAEKPRRRFLPQPIEESSRSSKSRSNGEHTNGTTEKKPRRFAVEPVETVRRTRRRNSGNALQPGDKTDDSPGDRLQLPTTSNPHGPPPPTNTPYDEVAPGAGTESRFSYANLAKNTSRQSSMRRPSLDPISSVPESDDSGLSKPSSEATTESTHLAARREPGIPMPGPRQKNLQKESYDEVFNGYLLDMAARQAQQQLQEQAADAYPNERIHQPVDHFAVDRESDSDTEIGVGQLTGHDEEPMTETANGAPVGWDATDFQRLRASMEEKKGVSPGPAPKKDPFGAAFSMAGIGGAAQPPRDPEIKNMRQVARPPMLGSSLVFPKCPSPRMTMIDPLQRHGTRRNTQVASRPQSGLWSPGCASPPKKESPKSSLSLWGGNCTAEQADRMNALHSPTQQIGILTPAIAPDEDPFTRWNNDVPLQTQLKKQHQLASNPGSRVNSVLGIDQLLAMEQRIASEYPDEFVTQIYNYLSLGYPAIAREFDDELSKISKIPVEAIRSDDLRKNTKGYVNAPEGAGAQQDDVKTQCGRWRALRLYIHEWARQQPNMMLEGADQSWGSTARRGSWFS